eukprot:COSAG01_NODE_220_length_21453_cov_118.998361_7_plen_277_part_00
MSYLSPSFKVLPNNCTVATSRYQYSTLYPVHPYSCTRPSRARKRAVHCWALSSYFSFSAWLFFQVCLEGLRTTMRKQEIRTYFEAAVARIEDSIVSIQSAKQSQLILSSDMDAENAHQFQLTQHLQPSSAKASYIPIDTYPASTSSSPQPPPAANCSASTCRRHRVQRLLGGRRGGGDGGGMQLRRVMSVLATMHARTPARARSGRARLSLARGGGRRRPGAAGAGAGPRRGEGGGGEGRGGGGGRARRRRRAPWQKTPPARVRTSYAPNHSTAGV